MVNYTIRRILAAIPVLLIVAVIVFLIVRVIPGDPAYAILGENATIEEVEALRARMGLNEPLIIQFVDWFGDILKGDFGKSLHYDKNVTDAIFERIEPTLILVFFSISIAVIIGIPIGIIASINRGKLLDKTVMVVSLAGISMPSFWLGLNLILLFSVSLNLFPAVGYIPVSEGGIFMAMHSLILPSFAMGLQKAAAIARMTRSTMLDVLNNDYVRTARAKGLSEYIIIIKHVLKNSMIPVLTQIGTALARLAGGSVVIETIFNIPGVGQLAYASIIRRDYTVIQAHILFVALLYIFINLIIDLLYKFFDPRVEYN